MAINKNKPAVQPKTEECRNIQKTLCILV